MEKVFNIGGEGFNFVIFRHTEGKEVKFTYSPQ